MENTVLLGDKLPLSDTYLLLNYRRDFSEDHRLITDYNIVVQHPLPTLALTGLTQASMLVDTETRKHGLLGLVEEFKRGFETTIQHFLSDDAKKLSASLHRVFSDPIPYDSSRKDFHQWAFFEVIAFKTSLGLVRLGRIRNKVEYNPSSLDHLNRIEITDFVIFGHDEDACEFYEVRKKHASPIACILKRALAVYGDEACNFEKHGQLDLAILAKVLDGGKI